MLCKVKSLAFNGLDPIPVDVEVCISGAGLPAFDIVGLPNKSIEESKHRVKSAIKNSGLAFPNKKITVNLAPADIHKVGSFYDLAIAAGILCACENITIDERLVFFGELSLDGTIRRTRGTLNAALFTQLSAYRGLVTSENVGDLQRYCSNIELYCYPSLLMLYKSLTGRDVMTNYRSTSVANSSVNIGNQNYEINIDDIIGQDTVKKMLAVSLAGCHHLLMIGSPGVGKTLLALSIKSLMPKLSIDESLEVARIYSLVGNSITDNPFMLYPPFRNPHHSTTYIGMIGGGTNPAPGEITLAHLGVLFMDEFCEFPRQVIEVLRQPLESGFISLTRAKYKVQFPAKFTLLAATNPCKCGYKGDATHKCTCTDRDVRNYFGRLSGPILDRIDLVTRVTKVSDLLNNVAGKRKGITADTLRTYIDTARDIQKSRKSAGYLYNRDIPFHTIQSGVFLNRALILLLQKAADTYNLSGRACHKIIKVAQTLADMEGADTIGESHLLESIQYKCEGTF